MFGTIVMITMFLLRLVIPLVLLLLVGFTVAQRSDLARL